MLKVGFAPRGLGGGTAVVNGLPIASGDLYLKADGNNTVNGLIKPSVDAQISLGTSGLPFASGHFKAIYIDTPETIAGSVTNSGVALIDVIATTFIEVFLRNPANSTYYPGTALQLMTTSSGIALSGSELKMLSGGDLRFTTVGSPTASSAYDLCFYRKQAGWVAISNSGLTNTSGSIDCTSGIFNSGVILRVTGQSSGSVVGVSNDGLLTVTGPFNV